MIFSMAPGVPNLMMTQSSVGGRLRLVSPGPTYVRPVEALEDYSWGKRTYRCSTMRCRPAPNRRGRHAQLQDLGQLPPYAETGHSTCRIDVQTNMRPSVDGGGNRHILRTGLQSHRPDNGGPSHGVSERLRFAPGA